MVLCALAVQAAQVPLKEIMKVQSDDVRCMKTYNFTPFCINVYANTRGIGVLLHHAFFSILLYMSIKHKAATN